MPDPVSIGTLVSAALAAGAVAVGKETATSAVRQAFDALRNLAKRWIGDDAEKLVAAPDDALRADLVARDVEASLPEAARDELRRAAERLQAELGNAPDTVTETRTATAGDGGLANAGTFRAGTVNIGVPPANDPHEDLRSPTRRPDASRGPTER